MLKATGRFNMWKKKEQEKLSRFKVILSDSAASEK